MLVGSNVFFKDIEGFTSKDIDILEFVDENTRNVFKELINKYQKMLDFLETCYNKEAYEVED